MPVSMPGTIESAIAFDLRLEGRPELRDSGIESSGGVIQFRAGSSFKSRSSGSEDGIDGSGIRERARWLERSGPMGAGRIGIVESAAVVEPKPGVSNAEAAKIETEVEGVEWGALSGPAAGPSVFSSTVPAARVGRVRDTS